MFRLERWRQLALGAVLATLCGAAAAAPGSAAMTLIGPRVPGTDRWYDGTPMTLVGPAGARLTRVRWRHAAAPTAAVDIELCINQRCIAAASERGTSSGLAGLAGPFVIVVRGRLRRGQRAAVRLMPLQLLLEYE